MARYAQHLQSMSDPLELESPRHIQCVARTTSSHFFSRHMNMMGTFCCSFLGWCGKAPVIEDLDIQSITTSRYMCWPTASILSDTSTATRYSRTGAQSLAGEWERIWVVSPFARWSADWWWAPSVDALAVLLPLCLGSHGLSPDVALFSNLCKIS